MSDRQLITFPFDVPAFDEPIELRPGLLWVRTRLPFALDHINLWLMDDGDSWTIVDTGVANSATRELWERLLSTRLSAKPVARVLVTHFHPDHVGLAGWLCARTGAPLSMARTEWLMAKALAFDETADFVEEGVRFDRRAGLEEELVSQRRERGHLYRKGVSQPPASLTRIRADDQLGLGGASFRVIIGEGHAPEQVTLFSAELSLLIAADQVLPRISPVVGVWPQIPDADPLGDFLRSLGQYRDLPDDSLVLPSHGLPFYGLHARLDQLAVHHEERLARTHELVHAPVTAADVMRGLFDRPLTVQDVGFALVEALAHLNYLVQRGEVGRWLAGDGAYRYARA